MGGLTIKEEQMKFMTTLLIAMFLGVLLRMIDTHSGLLPRRINEFTITQRVIHDAYLFLIGYFVLKVYFKNGISAKIIEWVDKYKN